MTKESDFLRYFNSGSSYWGYGEYVTGDNDLDISLPTLLNLKDDDVKPYGKVILEFLETDESFRELKAGIRAYSQFQDIFGIAVQDTGTWTNRHYCFFESLVYLKESVVSWLDKNILASLVLLRPFLELSILHIYWYLRCEERGYDVYYEWLNGKKKNPHSET